MSSSKKSSSLSGTNLDSAATSRSLFSNNGSHNNVDAATNPRQRTLAQECFDSSDYDSDATTMILPRRETVTVAPRRLQFNSVSSSSSSGSSPITMTNDLIQESRIKNNLTFGIFAEDSVVCRTCPVPRHGYFLRQPRSYGPFNRRLFESDDGHGTSGEGSSAESGYQTRPTQLLAAANDTFIPARHIQADEDDDVTSAFNSLSLSK